MLNPFSKNLTIYLFGFSILLFSLYFHKLGFVFILFWPLQTTALPFRRMQNTFRSISFFFFPFRALLSLAISPPMMFWHAVFRLGWNEKKINRNFVALWKTELGSTKIECVPGTRKQRLLLNYVKSSESLDSMSQHRPFRYGKLCSTESLNEK